MISAKDKCPSWAYRSQMTGENHSASPECPLRPGEPCLLCHPSTKTGPDDCPTAQMVLQDKDWFEELQQARDQAVREGPSGI